MSPRTLTPAARGVLLAVRGALRAGRVELSDRDDGTTLAVATAPDGAELLRAVVRATVRAGDPRQLALPGVEEPPATVRAGDPAPPERAEAPAAHTDPARVRVWISEEQWDSQGDDGREILQRPASEPVAWSGRVGWVTALVSPGATLGQLRSLQRELGYTLHEGDEPPVRIRGLAVGDVIDFDEEGPCTVTTLSDEGMELRAHGDGDDGDEDTELKVFWSEVIEERPGRWVVRPVDTATPAEKAKRSRRDPKPSKASKPARPAKAKPHRLTPEPEADALAIHSETVIAWQTEPGGAWERVWTEGDPGKLSKAAAWKRACEGHRAREYNRGGKCTRDSRDEGGAS